MQSKTRTRITWFIGGLLVLTVIPFALASYRRSSLGESHWIARSEMLWACPLRRQFDGQMDSPEFSAVRLAFVADTRLHFTIDADGLCTHLLASRKLSVEVKFDVTHKRFLGTTSISPVLVDGFSRRESKYRWGYTGFACPDSPCTNAGDLLHN